VKLAQSGLLFVLVLGGGCLASGGVSYGVVAPAPRATVVVDSGPAPVAQGGVYVEPDLVEIQPGVQVIYDYDQPVFYSDGFYWRQDNGIWYSSRVHTGGWGRVERPPERFRTIQTSAYVHYRPAGYVPRNQRGGGGVEVRDHREPMREPPRQEPVVRDHREPMREPVREPPRQEPVVRDHREPVRAPAPPPPAPAPVVRDHRAPAPAPAPAPPPDVRDHRKH